MRRSLLLGAILVAALAVPVAVRAHEGHVHKVMGTVATRHDNQVDVKTQDGKTVTVILNAKTTFVRGKQKVDAASINVGERVVVEVAGEKDMTAKAVTLAAAPAAVAKK